MRTVTGRLVQVKSAAPMLSRPIEMWRRAFDAVGLLDEHFGGRGVFGAPSLRGMGLGEAFPALLHHLYAAGGSPIPLERFHRSVREAVNQRMGCVVDDLAAVQELLRFLERAEDPQHRELALRALARTGTPGRERPRRAAHRPASGGQPRAECDARGRRA